MSEKQDSGKDKSKSKVNCPPDKIIYDANMGARICLETGEVIEEQVIGDEAEWRAYTPDETARRTIIIKQTKYGSRRVYWQFP